MSVHQLKDGRIFVQYRNHAKSSGYSRKYFGRGVDAEQRAKKFNDSLELRPYEKKKFDRSPYFGALAADYRDLHTMQPSTYRNLCYRLAATILPELNDVRVSRLTVSRLDKYVRMRMQKDKVKATTVSREVDYIQGILNWSVQRKYIDRNPVAGYQKPKRDDRRIAPPTGAEVAKIMAHAQPHLRLALAISFYTGLRPGLAEMLRLKLSDVSFYENTIHITSARKGGIDARTVPLHPLLRLLLKDRADEGEKTPYLIHYKGRPINSLNRAFNGAKRRAGIKRRLRMYDFRHAFATYALENGSDLKSVSRILGHKQISTTVERYQHICDKLMQDAVASIPTLPLVQQLPKTKGAAKRKQHLRLVKH